MISTAKKHPTRLNNTMPRLVFIVCPSECEGQLAHGAGYGRSDVKIVAYCVPAAAVLASVVHAQNVAAAKHAEFQNVGGVSGQDAVNVAIDVDKVDAAVVQKSGRNALAVLGVVAASLKFDCLHDVPL